MDHWRLAFDVRHKLIRGFDPDANDDPWNETTLERSLEEREPRLYDLDEDPDETDNVAGARPTVVDRLAASLAEMRRSDGRGPPTSSS